MKRLIRNKVLLILAGLVIFSIPVAALTFAECDVNHDGSINVLDLVVAKKNPDDYDQTFRNELTDVLLEKSEPTENSSGNQGGSGSQSGGSSSGGQIFLPEIP